MTPSFEIVHAKRAPDFLVRVTCEPRPGVIWSAQMNILFFDWKRTKPQVRVSELQPLLHRAQAFMKTPLGRANLAMVFGQFVTDIDAKLGGVVLNRGYERPPQHTRFEGGVFKDVHPAMQGEIK